MPKLLFNDVTAPKAVRESIGAMIASGDLCGAVTYACSAGYDVPEPIEAHAHRVNALREAGQLVEAAEYAVRHADAIDVQRRAHAMWLGRRAWAAKPSAIELAEAAKVEREAEARAKIVEQRTAEILAAAEAETREKRVADAKRRAEKEIGK